MPNQYKNKVVYGDSVLMDITDTTAEAGDVASGAVFYAKNGARTVGTFVQAQSDWEEDDSTDPAFILNKPPVIAGDGENSTVENSFEISSAGPTVYTLLITGAANSTDFTFTTNDTLPTQSFMKNYGFADYTKSDSSHVYATITGFNKTNGTISFSNALDTSAISSRTLKIYYAYHKAFGKCSHAEGQLSNASGFASHAEGTFSHAIGNSAHAEGGSSLAIGDYTHAEGNKATAKGEYSHAEGYYTRAGSNYQHVQGKYNIEDASNIYADIIGNGSSSARSNAYTLDWSGNGWFAGKVSAGTVDTPASVTKANDLTTKEYVDNAISQSGQNKQGKAVYGSTNTNDSNYISPFLASVCIVDDHLNLVISHNTNAYGQLFFNSWNVATTVNLIVSNVILYNNGLLCATLIGNTALDTNTWVFTVYPIQDALTFDSTPIIHSTNPVTSGGVYTALSNKANSADIPSASSSTPLADGTAAVGTSSAYARADHVHPKIPIDSTLSTTSENPVQNKVIQSALVNKLDFNTNYNPIPLDFPDPENPPATLDGATITCGLDFADILELYQLAIDTSFELLDIIQNHNFIVFHPFRINDANESIELFSIFDNTIYTITLEPNIDSGMTHGMIGTLHVKDSVTIDSALSSSSTNPVTNSAITTAIANNRGKVFYGVVDNTSTATAFTAQIPGITAYEEGLVVILKNGVVTSASGFTININGLGALPVYNNLAASTRDTTIFNKDYTMMFIYEHRVSGGDWLCYRGYDANTNTIGYQLRTNSMSLPMKSITYRYRLLFTSADGAHFVPANNTTSTNATASRAVCQDKIDPFGPIYYYGTTASVAANSRPSATNLWEQYAIALGYSFNRTGAALTLSSWKPVYVKCAPQADGSAIMDATTPYVQDLPTTADGKIYIFLGVAYSATNIELVAHHPVYCYRNGGIQEWTGIQEEIDTINTRIDGCVTTEELDDALANLPSGGGSTAPTLLGNTPVKLTEDTNIKLNASGSCTYTLEGDTVVDFDILHGTTVKATITFEDSVYKLKAGSDASAWYNTYIDIFVDGLTVGTAYTFVFDADGCTFNTSQHITVGHYILYDNNGNTLVTRGSTDSNSLNSYAFTAPTTRVKLRWYPSINSYYSAGVSVATVNRIYINKAGTTEHTSIVNSSGSFTDTVELGSVSRGVTISSTPVAAVYKVASSGGGASKPLEGKTIVVFGDSLIGMYRGETSATSYIKNVTGATVYNVGFGGCRMATHPTNGYAQFSMWALADAVASGVWTSQDQYASSGSDYFAEQLATLKSIDFNNVDYVVIHYGTNDFGGGVPLGLNSSSTDCTTFCGAARHSIETLLSAYPKLRIYISLPVYRYWESGGVITYAETYQNSQNVILLEYISALTTIATEYYLPIIDGYHELGINRLNASTFLSDGTHHNAIGRRRFGEFIGSKIISSM